MQDLSPEDLRQAGMLAANAFDREQKDLAAYVLVAQCVFEAALALADRRPEKAAQYKSVAMMTSFNIAAACWPGWDDAHQNITDTQLALALEMSRFNVATAEELGMAPDRRVNGCWILGAHLLANGDLAGAKATFTEAAAWGEKTDGKESALMARGWMLACDILAGDSGKQAELDALEETLKALGDDGAFYASQYAHAIKVFSRP